MKATIINLTVAKLVKQEIISLKLSALSQLRSLKSIETQYDFQKLIDMGPPSVLQDVIRGLRRNIKTLENKIKELQNKK